jgi:hypothetical protein
VLAVAAAALLLVLASASTTWRAYRGARAAVAAARVDMAAERGVAHAIEAALADSIRERPLGDTVRTAIIDGDGLTVAASAVRSAPFVLWVSALASEGGGGAPAAARAARARVERLAPPLWPLRAALTTTSPVDSAAARLWGAVPDDATDCQGERSRPVPAARQLPVDSVRAPLASGWSAALARAAPWRPPDANEGRWRVQVIPEADSVLSGPRRWQGLLLHHGPLRLLGALDGRGVLIVRGALDASAARLTVSGAVLVDDPQQRTVRLGAATLQWNRCAVAMALATIATPRAAPFHAASGLVP